jgi:UDP-N-acetylmuramoylalanine--D-glutamate ligase
LSELFGKNVVIVGLGASGAAAARLCLRRGARVVANDSKPRDAFEDVARELERLGAKVIAGSHHRAGIEEAEIVVVSPGVPPIAEIASAEARGAAVWGEVELAVRSMTHPAPVIAVGGTNGKSTTTSLVAGFLLAQGLRVFAGGNLGEPLADHADESFDVLVLEVSSFQMERLDRFKPHVSALLNVTEDHLDRYAGLEAYARAKGNAFVRQSETDWAVVPAGDDVCMEQARRGHARVVTFGPGGTVAVTNDAVIDRSTGERFDQAEIALAGGHNLLNVAASIACVHPFGVVPERMRRVLREFRGLPHRTALVACVCGVGFYDDSKGTNVGAAVTALQGLRESKAVLIAGGRDKGGSYSPLAEALARKGRAVVLIGEAADAMSRAIGSGLPVRRASSMQEAVRLAASLALAGDAVLLSPACSSFDMFRDYKDRGDAFIRAVRKLEKEAAA